MASKTRKRTKSQPKLVYKFEVRVERDSVQHDIADQTLQLSRTDRDILYYSGNLAEKNDYDHMLELHADDIRRERAQRKRLRRKLGI